MKNIFAKQLLQLARMVLGGRKSPMELRKQDEYNRENQNDINDAMQELREKNPDRYKRPGGVSGDRRNR